MIKEHFYKAIKYMFSFLKSDWQISDYPLRYRHQEVIEHDEDSRFVMYPWMVQIVNWESLSGSGKTREEALENLRINFEKRKAAGEETPRPGVKAPLQFAPTEKIIEYERIEEEFFEKILGMSVDGIFTSDQSSLDDFVWTTSNKEYELRMAEIMDKVKVIYNVDISILEDTTLVGIYRLIEENQNKSL